MSVSFFACEGASIYDVRTEGGQAGGSRNMYSGKRLQ